MTDPTPWLVVQYGPEVPERTFRLCCLRCGTRHDVALPIAVTALVKIHRTFNRDHGRCGEARDCLGSADPVLSRWLPMDRLDPNSQRYDVADCDSWNVPGKRSTGPCDPAWKGDYDRGAAWCRAGFGVHGGDCDSETPG